MLFTSFEFTLFISIVFILYWFVFSYRRNIQNIFILTISYIFYGWWNWRFLGLILFSTVIDYCIGLLLGKTKNQRRRLILLFVSLFANLGCLFYFKYYNFFIDSICQLVNVEKAFPIVSVILPVGISFYTFQTLSYTIDIYNKKIEPTKSFIIFASFVSFFPQLVAGPIEKASDLICQFKYPRVFKYNQCVDGMRQILWGVFKKMVIADNCAYFVDIAFGDYYNYFGSTLLTATILFSFQIYCDFSGYSDIAIGVSRLLGFELKTNFNYPYFSEDISTFWKRWHISLSNWFRDYVYIPLGGNRVSSVLKVRNIFVVFLLSGLWHGANWTFIVWGVLHALYVTMSVILKRSQKSTNEYFSLNRFFSILGTFAFVSFAWIFFRADSLVDAIMIIRQIFSSSIFTYPFWEQKSKLALVAVLIIVFLIVEWYGQNDRYAIENLPKHKILRWFIYCLLVVSIIMYTPTTETNFIYFQF